MKRFAVLILVGSMLLTACGETKSATEHPDTHNHQTELANGDIQERTASAEVLPVFLNQQSDEMKVVYQAAAKSAELLQWIPCYCGCGESAGHLNSLNCFVHEIRKDGSVVWDDHGTRCQTCVEIAVTAIRLKQEGNSTLEIRNQIDTQYGEGYAEPTDTKMPTAS